MPTIVSYKTPQQFLDATLALLEQRELENNLIIGICNNLPDQKREYKNCVFINAVEDNKIEATSIKTISKAIVSAAHPNEEAIRTLAEYYIKSKIDLSGVFGETTPADMFAKYYSKKEMKRVTMLVHQLTVINSLPLASGQFEKATLQDLDKMLEWTINFEKDAEIPIRKNREQTQEDTKSRIGKGVLYKWIYNEEIVSIAAIVRQTKTAGIVGLVYTPNHLRGRGYATACVHKLSEYILQSGFKSCGLFTDKANPTSNSIYRKIGYTVLSEFADIEFLN